MGGVGFWVFGLLRGCGAVGECGERSQQRLGDRSIRGEEAGRGQQCQVWPGAVLHLIAAEESAQLPGGHSEAPGATGE